MEADAAKLQDIEPPTSHEVEPSTPEEAAPAVRSILGPDLFVGFDFGDRAASVADFVASLIAARTKAFERLPRLGTELFNTMIGRSAIEPDPPDKRFSDPAWKENP